jgi:hypothetical protein
MTSGLSFLPPAVRARVERRGATFAAFVFEIDFLFFMRN